MVGESFHPRGCWGEDSNHIRLGATVQKLLRLFAFGQAKTVRMGAQTLQSPTFRGSWKTVVELFARTNSREYRFFPLRWRRWQIPAQGWALATLEKRVGREP